MDTCTECSDHIWKLSELSEGNYSYKKASHITKYGKQNKIYN